MLRSLAAPGWGQLHNHAWLKAAAVAGTEIALGVNLYRDSRELNRLQDRAERARGAGDGAGYSAAVNAYNARLSRFVGRQWMLGGIVGYALVDAYVDANFRNFDFEFEHDPALPGGAPPAAKLRAGWRWRF